MKKCIILNWIFSIILILIGLGGITSFIVLLVLHEDVTNFIAPFIFSILLVILEIIDIIKLRK